MTLDEASKIRGAVYIPAQAYNASQMWRDYDRGLIERDLGYAARLKLNALRVFLSYEYWLEDRGRFENSFYHLLHSAWGHKIRILAVLFSCRGAEPPEEAPADQQHRAEAPRPGDAEPGKEVQADQQHRTEAPTPGNAEPGEEMPADQTPAAPTWLRSPGSKQIDDPATWIGIEDYVNWFMQRWGHEHRVLALEIVDEPRTVNEFKFARQMLLRASRHRKSLPLTFGARRLEDSRFFQDLGLDVLQIHQSAGRREDQRRRQLELAVQTQDILQRPVLLAEWQPASASMAAIVNSYPLGNFFWSLMVRPAELKNRRKQRPGSGIFHENGAVWSLADARAISRDPGFSAEERQTVG